jgi:hypothetical protein
VKSHVGLTSVHAMKKSYDHLMSQALRKVTKQVPTIIKQMKSMGVRMKNHIVTLVMCREQPESINHMFSNPLSNTYIG